ncbi:hypothetical protein CYLTODRAFT_390454 [Cylindrobasidium torrendii FP15055 ss-10]|uniref:Uncharacterized protein n=1 Tax=Cylindrobasidium torrendii FP15055 ss-10 TaxID=1314674 RepID=A0A0D7BLY2_9AGAR|nr:hypothetical protein CYLTODRAFT_390454 [Cylindrobasidium torrendii FP15055 ss-10]
MRLNRAGAIARDRGRATVALGQGAEEDQACLSLFNELMESWSRRTKLIKYCIDVAAENIESKQDIAKDQNASFAEQRRAKQEAYGHRVMRDQVRSELSVEVIVRKRAYEAFHSRCKYFSPAASSDKEVLSMWDSVQAGRSG